VANWMWQFDALNAKLELIGLFVAKGLSSG